jgi:hypothetical protein
MGSLLRSEERCERLASAVGDFFFSELQYILPPQAVLFPQSLFSLRYLQRSHTASPCLSATPLELNS